MKSSFLFDRTKCTGCHACTLACTIENGLEWGRSWRRIEQFNDVAYPGVPSFPLSLACNHCDDAACMAACPAMAYSRDVATGAVEIDPDLCVGCRYCSWACPYDAPLYDEKKGVMEKCTLCDHRLREGRDPACTVSCPTGALRFGPPEGGGPTDVTEGFLVTDLGPRIRFDDAPPGPRAPEATAPPPERPFGGERRKPAAEVMLRSEWSLAFFTWAASILVAAFAAHASGSFRLRAVPFLFAAAAAMLLSAVHLGRKERALRAALHASSSWLSREILLFGVFTAAGFFVLLSGAPPFAAWCAAVAGFAALASIDGVYRFARAPSPVGLHSAGALLTGIFLAGVFSGRPLVALAAGALKATLYAARKIDGRKGGDDPRIFLSALRLGAGLLLPAASLLGLPVGGNVVILLLLAGEAIDRAEFTHELRFVSPAATLRAAFRRRLADSPVPPKGTVD